MAAAHLDGVQDEAAQLLKEAGFTMLGQLFSKMHELAILKAIRGWRHKLATDDFTVAGLAAALQKNQAVLRLLNATLVKWNEQALGRSVRDWWKKMLQVGREKEIAAIEAESREAAANADEEVKRHQDEAAEERDRLLARLEEQELNGMLAALANAFRKLGWLFRVWMQNSMVSKCALLKRM